jgi:L-threonylcarbamoyladenylate synthase
MRVLDGADPDAIRDAAAALLAGRLVVVPTETVYGLAANALDPLAVARIFAAKGRPSDNPVIVHVADAEAAHRLTGEWPDGAHQLARRFWPGPLTMVLPRSPAVPDIVSNGLPTVAVRVPDHPVAAALLRASGVPIAAPSANVSGRPSPTLVEHAIHDLGDAVDIYLDGGPCEVGVESTIVGWAEGHHLVFREGGIPIERIEPVFGRLGHARPASRPVAPGMKYRHYAPRAPLVLVTPGEVERTWRSAGPTAVALVSEESGLRGLRVTVVGSRTDDARWARDLFALLRAADATSPSAIVVEAIPERGLGRAVMERLRKAAAAQGDEQP